MPDAQIVGRVAIKILPDTSRFKEEARAELERAEKGLEVKARVKLDGDDIRAQAGKIEAEAKEALKSISLRVNLDDEASLKAAIARVQAELSRLGTITLPIDVNEASLQAGLDLLRERLAEIASIKLRVDESSQASVKAAIAQIDAELAKLREIEIDVNLNEADLIAMRELLSENLRLEVDLDWDDDASIKAAIAKVNAELAKLSTARLNVELDEASLLRARADLQTMLDTRAQVKIDLDRAEAQRIYDSIRAAVDNVTVNPKLDPQAVAKLKRQLEATYAQMADLRAKITPELDALAKAKVEREIDDLQDKIDGLKAEIEPETSKAGVALVMAEMARLARSRIVNLIPKVSATGAATALATLKALSGARVLSSTFEKLSNTLRNLDRNIPIIGTLAAAIAGLSGWLLSAASNMFSLSSSLAQIGPTVALLPGLLGGFAVGLGVTVAAFKDFNKVVPEAKKALSGLQDVISKNFWEKAKDPIRDFVTDLLPQFRSGVEKTATELGGFFAAFATDLKGALKPALDQMFGDLSQSIDTATKGTGAFANIIAVLGKVGTSYLPRLAEWFVDISERFSNFLDRKGENGIKSEIDEGIQALKDLGGVLKNTAGIFSGLNRAATAAGGSTLSSLNNRLREIHATVDSPGFQSGMTDVFKASHQAMDNIANISGPAVSEMFKELGKVLTVVLPKAGEVIGQAFHAIARALTQPEVAQGIIALFDGLKAAVDTLTPAMPPLGQALGALMQVIAVMLPVFAGLVTAALIPAAEAFSALAPKVSPIIELLGGALTQAVMSLTPTIERITPAIGRGLGGAVQELTKVLPPLVGLFRDVVDAAVPVGKELGSALAPILPVLAAALAKVVTACEPVLEVLLRILREVIEPLLPKLSEVIRAVLPPLADAIKRLLESLQPILEALLKLVQFLMPVLAPALAFIAELIGISLVMAVNGLALVFEGLVEIVVGAWDTIVGAIRVAWEILVGIFTGNFAGLGDAWSQFWNGLWTFVKGIWDTILGAFLVFLNVGILSAATKGLKAIGEAFKAGWKAVDDFGKSAWSAIESGFASFGSKLVSAGKTMVTSLGSGIKAGWTTIKTEAQAAFTELKTKIQTLIDDAVRLVKDFPQRAKDALGSLSSTLFSVGVDLVQGLINGIGSMANALLEKAKSLASSVGNAFKGALGIKSPSRVFIAIGKFTMQGLLVGLESRYSAVRTSLASLTRDVAATQFETPGLGRVGVSGRVASAVNNALVGGQGGGTTRVLNYYAAPGSSLGSEEDLFAAANRTRFGW
ncbi:hypothetical protein [Streptodolium elevatio]|uniref:Tape measure protein n=1 Tax=Streptodolium elevatio TaxID=3157996 RepID=A0ABV3DE08_9ACTN